MSVDSLIFPQGPWEILLKRAYSLFSEIENKGITIPRWSLGGGTVLMFHYNHRMSKDIDIFLPDPQFLGYVNPRLSEEAESLTSEYIEAEHHIKLYFEEGEIDFIATAPLTKNPFYQYPVLGKSILLEKPLEIVAKKMWHRGEMATARDLFDLALVIEKIPDEFEASKAIFLKNAQVFISQCHDRKDILKVQFEQIQLINYQKTYNECLEIVEKFLDRLAS